MVSELTETLVGRIPNGKEIISTEDMVGKVEMLSKDLVGWTESMA